MSLVQSQLLTTYLPPSSSTSNPKSSRDNGLQSSPKGSASSNNPSTIKSASTSTSATLSSFDKISDIPGHLDYSIDRFNSDTDNSQPVYQYTSSDESMLVSKARMGTILGNFNTVYHKK